MLTWQIGETAAEQALHIVSDGVLQHGRSLAVGGHAKPLVCLVRDQNGLVVIPNDVGHFTRHTLLKSLNGRPC